MKDFYMKVKQDETSAVALRSLMSLNDKKVTRVDK